MRRLFAIFFSLMLSFNAAYAGVASICDAFEHFPLEVPEHKVHLWHHDHHDDQTSHESSDASSDKSADGSSMAKVTDHFHSHASFSPILIGDTALAIEKGSHILAFLPLTVPASVVPVQLERPPRAFLA